MLLDETVVPTAYGQCLPVGQRHVLQSHSDGGTATQKQELEDHAFDGEAP